MRSGRAPDGRLPAAAAQAAPEPGSSPAARWSRPSRTSPRQRCPASARRPRRCGWPAPSCSTSMPSATPAICCSIWAKTFCLSSSGSASKASRSATSFSNIARRTGRRSMRILFGSAGSSTAGGGGPKRPPRSNAGSRRRPWWRPAGRGATGRGGRPVRRAGWPEAADVRPPREPSIGRRAEAPAGAHAAHLDVLDQLGEVTELQVDVRRRRRRDRHRHCGHRLRLRRGRGLRRSGRILGRPQRGVDRAILFPLGALPGRGGPRVHRHRPHVGRRQFHQRLDTLTELRRHRPHPLAQLARELRRLGRRRVPNRLRVAGVRVVRDRADRHDGQEEEHDDQSKSKIHVGLQSTSGPNARHI